MKYLKGWSILLICFFLFPFMVFAKEGIENYYISATVMENGDLTVEEYFYMNGTYNGMEKEIYFRNSDAYPFQADLSSYGGSSLHNGSSLILHSIESVDILDDFDFAKLSGKTLFSKVSSAQKGDKGVYTVFDQDVGYRYKIFLPSKEKKAFYLKYTLRNMAVLHNDVGELFWNIFNNNFKEAVANLEIKIKFPSNQQEFRVWAHGPLNGNIKKISDDTLYASVTNVPAYRALDIRAVFDKKVILNSPKLSHVEALAKILNYEENAAEQANYERAQKEYKNQTEAYDELKYCNYWLMRSCYQKLLRDISKVTDPTVKLDLEEKAAELLKNIIKEEEDRANTSVNTAEKIPRYSYYEAALEDVSILENRELKNSLSARLDVVKSIIYEQEKVVNRNVFIFSSCLFVILIGLFIYVYVHCDKEYNSNFKEKYMRDFPNDFSPSTVRYLMKKDISNEAISAEILNLIYLKIIIMKKGTSNKKDDYILTKNKDYQKELSIREKKLLGFLFDGQEEISLGAFQKRARSSSTRFVQKWDQLKKLYLKEAMAKEIYIDDDIVTSMKENNKKPFWVLLLIAFLIVCSGAIVFGFIIGFIAILCFGNIFKRLSFKGQSRERKIKFAARLLIWGIFIVSVVCLIVLFIENHYVKSALFPIFISLLFSVYFFFYISNIKKRTKDGAEEFAKWSAFQRFLVDFGNFETRDLPEITLWDKYLVYAMALGCADKLGKMMKIKVQDFEALDSLDSFAFNSIALSSFGTIRSVVSSSVQQAYVVTSSSSSGSGVGGGFSSGGGSGGGGSGGGRF